MVLFEVKVTHTLEKTEWRKLFRIYKKKFTSCKKSHRTQVYLPNQMLVQILSLEFMKKKMVKPLGKFTENSLRLLRRQTT